MSKIEIDSYRFGSGVEPSDEILAQIMREVAVEAKESFELSCKKYFEELRKGMRDQESKWADRINEVRNGIHGS